MAVRIILSLGVDPRVLAERTLAAIRENCFWVLPPEGDPWRVAARLRHQSIDAGTNPKLGGPLAGGGRLIVVAACARTPEAE